MKCIAIEIFRIMVQIWKIGMSTAIILAGLPIKSLPRSLSTPPVHLASETIQTYGRAQDSHTESSLDYTEIYDRDRSNSGEQASHEACFYPNVPGISCDSSSHDMPLSNSLAHYCIGLLRLECCYCTFHLSYLALAWKASKDN